MSERCAQRPVFYLPMLSRQPTRLRLEPLDLETLDRVIQRRHEERAIPERATRDLAPAEQDRALASGRASVSAGPPGVGGKLLPRGAGLTTRQRIGLE
jgi:hypothetical protein